MHHPDQELREAGQGRLLGRHFRKYVESGQSHSTRYNNVQLRHQVSFVLPFYDCDPAIKKFAIIEPILTSHSIEDSAWAESSSKHPNFLQNAFGVLRLLDEDPKTKQLGIRPDAVTFKTLLKCITKSNRHDAGSMAEDLLNEMDQRRRDGNNLIAIDRGALTLAIRACIRSKDLMRAEKFVERIPDGPNRQDYEQLVRAWKQQRSNTVDKESQIARLEGILTTEFSTVIEATP